MSEYREEILKQVSESEIAEHLLTEHFDGVILVDARQGKAVMMSDRLTGRLKKFFCECGGYYDACIDLFAERSISQYNRGAVRRGLYLATVLEKLRTQKVYSYDLQTASGSEEAGAYKRLCYEYLNGKQDFIVLTCEDTSDIITNEIDPLTGLYNFIGFHNHVDEWLRRNPGKKYRIQRYNIDCFKDINGVYGYTMGNRLLRDFGHYMKRYDTENSFSAHLNADHFVRFCSEDSLSILEYYEAFQSCFTGYHLKMPITIHVGIYDLCESDCDSFTMSYKALLALQSTKGKFNKHIAYYERGMMGMEVEQLEFLNDVESAIANEEFEVWFQPQFNYKSGALIGAEALIRWRHPQKGLLAPGAFIPLLESSNQISIVDHYILEKTCRYMREWMDKMPDKPITVSVNLSRNDIYSPDFLENLKETVREYEIPVGSLWLEITESAYTDDSELLICATKELRREGFIIEMDDFGSGYSSLNTLKDIDIDILKLDMKFLSGEQNSQKSKIIISSVISMASELKLPVIAEGVETKEQAEMLLGFGCENMQGYYFSKPIPAEKFAEMLSATETFGTLDI